MRISDRLTASLHSLSTDVCSMFTRHVKHVYANNMHASASEPIEHLLEGRALPTTRPNAVVGSTLLNTYLVQRSPRSQRFLKLTLKLRKNCTKIEITDRSWGAEPLYVQWADTSPIIMSDRTISICLYMLQPKTYDRVGIFLNLIYRHDLWLTVAFIYQGSIDAQPFTF